MSQSGEPIGAGEAIPTEAGMDEDVPPKELWYTETLHLEKPKIEKNNLSQ